MSSKLPSQEDDSQEDEGQSVSVPRGKIQMWSDNFPDNVSVGSLIKRATPSEVRDLIDEYAYSKVPHLYKRLGESASPSSRKYNTGIVFHPFDMRAAVWMREISAHHGSCLDTLVDMTVGHGFKDEKIYDILDPLTQDGLDEEIQKMALGLFELGQGYLEVVRESGTLEGPIEGIHSQPPQNILRVMDGERVNEQHFLYTPYVYGASDWAHSQAYAPTYGDQVPFACFGDMRRVIQLSNSNVSGIEGPSSPLTGSELQPFVDSGEIIPFAMPTNMWEHYGAPRWLGAGAHLELNRKHLERTTIYMHNRGTPDTVTFLYGVRMTKEQLDEIRSCLNAGVGSGYGRSAVLTFPNATNNAAKAHVERFGDEIDGDTFQQIHDCNALAVCSAHRVPPILAGISTSRTMGAAAEQTQALVVTHILAVSKVQRLISKKLARTLGGPKGIPELRGNKFEFNTVLDSTEIAALNTMARSRQQDSILTGERDPSEGLSR